MNVYVRTTKFVQRAENKNALAGKMQYAALGVSRIRKKIGVD